MKPSSQILRITGNKGVTLIELLVAVAITVIVGASIVGALYSGRSAWESGDNIIRRHQNARAAIEFISRDLQQAFVFPEGDVYEAAFWSDGSDLIFSALGKVTADGFDLVWVAYSFNAAENRIERAEALYDDFGEPGSFSFNTLPFVELAWDIEGLQFDFHYRDPVTGDWEDEPAWDFLGTGVSEGRLPERVEISVLPVDSDEPVASSVKIPLSALRPYTQP